MSGTTWLLALAAAVASFFVFRYAQSRSEPAVEPGAAAAAPAAVDAPAPKLSTAPAPSAAPAGMVWVPGGQFWMGDNSLPDASPEHLVDVRGFWMDAHEVTNAEFAKFVEATGYKTIAELPIDPKDFPDARPEDLQDVPPGSIVFTPPTGLVRLDNHLQWWAYVPGASWRHPEGPDSTIAGRENHPVVQMAWEDAAAYAQWAGKRLPTEAEWELAARGGLDRAEYCWGNELRAGGKWQSNIWQGNFPNENSTDDGFRTTAPVGSYAPNGYGLFDVSGNVWEWCADWYRPDYYQHSPPANPRGPGSSFDPAEPGIAKRVQRGGSFMCADSYCRRYVPAARGKGEPKSAAGHIGFRCVRDAP
ncbi:MAG: formylglycine-generating enzyme family protein [Pirellulales bacterium]